MNTDSGFAGFGMNTDCHYPCSSVDIRVHPVRQAKLA